MSLVTWNPDDKDSTIELLDGNLKISKKRGSWAAVRATTPKIKGKWYWEIEVISFGHTVTFGVSTKDSPLVPGIGSVGNGYRLYRPITSGGGNLIIDNSTPSINWGNRLSSGDVVGLALDFETKSIGYYYNGVYQGGVFGDIGNFGEVYPTLTMYDNTTAIANFGDSPFKYELPDGFLPYSGIPIIKKHLIKADNKIHTLSEGMSVLTYPELTEPLTFEEYDEWGMDDLNGYEKPIEWVKRPMDEGEKVGEGRIVRKTVDKNEFVVNSLKIK